MFKFTIFFISIFLLLVFNISSQDNKRNKLERELLNEYLSLECTANEDRESNRVISESEKLQEIKEFKSISKTNPDMPSIEFYLKNRINECKSNKEKEEIVKNQDLNNKSADELAGIYIKKGKDPLEKSIRKTAIIQIKNKFKEVDYRGENLLKETIIDLIKSDE
jgi:hypothetical protein